MARDERTNERTNEGVLRGPRGPKNLSFLVTYQPTHGQRGIGARDAIAPKNLHKVTILLSNKLSNSVQLLCAKMTSHFREKLKSTVLEQC